jgi:hypothetical protein
LKRAAKKILVKQLKDWRENEAMMQKKKMQKKMEDDKSEEGDASMDDVAALAGKLKVDKSKTQVILVHWQQDSHSKMAKIQPPNPMARQG